MQPAVTEILLNENLPGGLVPKNSGRTVAFIAVELIIDYVANLFGVIGGQESLERRSLLRITMCLAALKIAGRYYVAFRVVIDNRGSLIGGTVQHPLNNIKQARFARPGVCS
jgi:hypothetical protein